VRAFGIARRGMVVLAILAVSLAAAACGGDDEPDSSAQAGSGGTQKLRIALYPSTDYAALYVGMHDGTFKKHGIELEIEQVLTGSAIMAAVTSGKADLGTNSSTAASTGIVNGLPINMVAAADLIPKKGYVEVLVRKDSGIQDFGDLAGKTVATINLEGSFHLATLNAVEAGGGDWKSVKALAMAPTDEPRALKSRRVDAIVLQDPFVATAKKDPAFKSLGNPFALFDFELVSGAFYASNKTIQQKSEILTKFGDALTEVSKKVQENQALAREIIPTYTQLPADVAKTITLPVYDTTIPEGAMTSMLERMKQYGWIKALPEEDKVVWNGS
jgi:NitT/TauT family transport system substrate-binding protein